MKSYSDQLTYDLVGAASRRLDAGEVHGLEFRVLYDDGDVRYLIANGKTLSGRAPGPGRVAGVFVDHTATMLSRQALSESDHRYRRLAELSKDACLLEQDGCFVYVNAAGLELFGVQNSEELMCRPSCEFLVLPRGRANERLYAALEASIRRSDGTEVEAELFGMSSIYRGKPAFQWVIRDVSERKHYQRQLEHQAKHDPLTGLPNRSEFLHRVQRLLRGDNQPRLERWAAVFLDLDHFKYVNDSLGHSAGDQLLKQVAQRLSTALRRDDLVARLGGDEFGMLLPLQRDEECDSVIERIMAAVRQPLKLPRSAHSVSCSLGVSLFECPEHTELSAESLLQQADAAMYRAKEGGRNTFRYFSWELNQRIDEPFRLESRLRHAIQNRELALYLKPQVSLDHGARLALQWQYHESGENGEGEGAALIAPPPEEMAALAKIALSGDMREVIRHAEHLRSIGVQYAPFADKLRELADNYQSKAIVRLIRKYADSEAES